MHVLLFNVFKHLLLRKTDVLKTCRKSNALALKRKKVQGKLSFVYKTVSQISIKLFFWGDKRLLSMLLRK